MSAKVSMLVGLIAATGLSTAGCTVTVDGARSGKGPTPENGDGTAQNENGLVPGDGNQNASDQQEELEAGRTDHTLAASETKTFRISAERGETLIINTSLPDSATDVDMFAYAPNDNRPVASTEGSSSGFENLTFLADETGRYTVDVVNLSPDQKAQLSLTVQRVPPQGGSQSVLNGVYKITEGQGQPVSPSSTAWFVFSDGKLTSVYGIINAEDFGLAHDYRYWVDGTSDDPSELHTVDLDVVLRVNRVDTQQDGTSLVFEYDVVGDVSNSPDGPARVEQTYRFEGIIAEEGRVLRGTATWQVDVNGFFWDSSDPTGDPVKMERTDE